MASPSSSRARADETDRRERSIARARESRRRRRSSSSTGGGNDDEVTFFDDSGCAVCFVVVVVVFKVVRVKKVVFEDGEEWSADVDEGWRLSVAWPPSPAGLLREQRRLELADAKRRGRARGRFALELGRARNRRRRRAVPLQSVRRSGYHPLAECVVVAASFKALFFCLLSVRVGRILALATRSFATKKKEAVVLRVFFVRVVAVVNEDNNNNDKVFFGRDARDAKSGVSLLSFSLKCFSTDPSYVFSPSSLRLRTNESNETDGLQFLQQFVATLVSKSRAPKSKEAYESIGGGSPLRRITDEQSEALKKSLVSKGLTNVKTYVGMRYWKPFTEEAIENIKRDRITRLVVLPLYPQFSISTSGSSLRLLEKIFREDPILSAGVLQHTVIPSWYSRPGYVSSMAKLIKNTLESDAFKDAPDKPVVFFSAHGVPTSYVSEGGDPYKDEMEECVKLITNELKKIGCEGYKHVLAYQSRVGPVEWLKPYTDDTIRALGNKGVKAMCAVPVSFVSEHIETLEEIDQEYRELAEENGIEYWGRVPALDCDEVFIDDLANAVVEALPANAVAALSDITTNISNNANLASNMDGSEIVPSKSSVEELLSVYDNLDLRIPTREFMYEADDVLPFVAVAAFCLFLGIQVRLGMEGIFVPGGGIIPSDVPPILFQ